MDRYNVYSLPKSFDGTYLCPLCQRTFFSEKTGRHYCPGCGLRITIEPPTQVEQEQALVAGTDWDKKSKGGVLHAFITTTLAGILRPRHFFAEVARDNKMFTAFTYMYWVQALIVVLSFFWMILLAPLLQFTSPLLLASPIVNEWIAYLGMPATLVWIAVVVLSILFTLLYLLFAASISLFLSAAFSHILLFLVGGAKQPFRATFRALAYLQTTTPLMLIPVVNILAAFYIIWVALIALSRAHGISWFRVFLSWCLPVVLLIAAVLGFRNFIH